MKDKITLTFNVYLADGFFEAVRKSYGYSNSDEVFGSDILQYLEENIKPAVSTSDLLEVEGGDTDGWFVQGMIDND